MWGVRVFGLFALVLLGFLLVSFAAFVFWIWAIIDVARTPDSVFAAVGHNKIVWIIVVVFLHIVGALVYLFAARPQLRRPYRGY